MPPTDNAPTPFAIGLSVPPIRVEARQISRHFGQEAVIRGFSRTFRAGTISAILGPNGSGKSTLLSLLSGMMAPTEGEIRYFLNDRPLSPEILYRYVSWAHPSLQLDHVLSLREAMELHRRFKPFIDGRSPHEVIETLGLAPYSERTLDRFSSGMLQRVKLGVAILSDTPLLLLDEPCTHLDRENVDRYHRLLETHGRDRTVVIASNYRADDIALCEEEDRVELVPKGEE